MKGFKYELIVWVMGMGYSQNTDILVALANPEYVSNKGNIL